MVDLRVVSGVSTINYAGSDDAFVGMRGTRDGSAITQDWILSQAFAGNAYVANAGTLSAPITFSASNTIIGTENDLDIAVPANTLFVPLEIRVHVETYGTSLQFQVMAMSGTGGAADSGTSVTPTNLRSDAPNSSGVTIVAAGGSSATAQTTNLSEFWRDGQQFAIDKTAASATVASQDKELYIWKYTDNMAPPILYSTSATSRMTVHVASESGTGFITCTYIELPQAAIG